MPLRERAIINNSIFEISLNEYYNVVKQIKEETKILEIDTRIEEDMEKKYVLIIANGDIIITDNGI
ncbi:hypothetical protein RFW93_19600, partial [Acinetobacter baumannii]|nr:hypothetical protein [Acinetobacter baumannii]